MGPQPSPENSLKGPKKIKITKRKILQNWIFETHPKNIPKEPKKAQNDLLKAKRKKR